MEGAGGGGSSAQVRRRAQTDDVGAARRRAVAAGTGSSPGSGGGGGSMDALSPLLHSPVMRRQRANSVSRPPMLSIPGGSAENLLDFSAPDMSNSNLDATAPNISSDVVARLRRKRRSSVSVETPHALLDAANMFRKGQRRLSITSAFSGDSAISTQSSDLRHSRLSTGSMRSLVVDLNKSASELMEDRKEAKLNGLIDMLEDEVAAIRHDNTMMEARVRASLKRYRHNKHKEINAFYAKLNGALDRAEKVLSSQSSAWENQQLLEQYHTMLGVTLRSSFFFLTGEGRDTPFDASCVAFCEKEQREAARAAGEELDGRATAPPSVDASRSPLGGRYGSPSVRSMSRAATTGRSTPLDDIDQYLYDIGEQREIRSASAAERSYRRQYPRKQKIEPAKSPTKKFQAASRTIVLAQSLKNKGERKRRPMSAAVRTSSSKSPTWSPRPTSAR